MEDINDNRPHGSQEQQLFQLLIPACRIMTQPGTDYAWLNGYCLISCSVEPDRVVLDGEVRIGDYPAENASLITGLAAALNPAAVLTGLDLTSTLSALGRLPIDAVDQVPALDLLGKLKAMLEAQTPIDLGVTSDTRDAVKAERLAMDLAIGRDRISSEAEKGWDPRLDNGNPCLLAETLADEASACLLAMGQLLLTQVQQTQLDIAWRNWRRHLVADLSGIEGWPASVT